MQDPHPLVNQPTFSTDKSFSFMKRPCTDLVFPYQMYPPGVYSQEKRIRLRKYKLITIFTWINITIG